MDGAGDGVRDPVDRVEMPEAEDVAVGGGLDRVVVPRVVDAVGDVVLLLGDPCRRRLAHRDVQARVPRPDRDGRVRGVDLLEDVVDAGLRRWVEPPRGQDARRVLRGRHHVVAVGQPEHFVEVRRAADRVHALRQMTIEAVFLHAAADIHDGEVAVRKRLQQERRFAGEPPHGHAVVVEDDRVVRRTEALDKGGGVELRLGRAVLLHREGREVGGQAADVMRRGVAAGRHVDRELLIDGLGNRYGELTVRRR